ncbi:MAG: asparagine synthase (glutamine-hydrolyzing) [Candidatus Omnitrophica bacterium]|nr:asparagine synthase (glutamine-hydrolyzing) [Candidatus Omnitrophota bacterium]
MCGICGIVSPKTIDEKLLRSMCRVLTHRGPDDEGIYLNKGVEKRIGLGHKRLSIIDLGGGHQPMHNEDETVWIVFNGEIYNFQDLRKWLEQNGHKFYTYTDTEVIIHLYEERGAECLNELRGMFAFAIWDENKKRLFLARDRVGKKPVVYAYQDNEFIFASELKSILEHPRIKREIEPCALDLYLTYQYVPSPWTIFKGINKLPPAHYLIYENGKVTINRYWELPWTPKMKIDEEEACEETIRLLEESTKLRLISDVPIGAFLSGGIDSSAVVAMMARTGAKPIKTFSIGFEVGSFNELKFARIIAKHFNTEHKEFIVKPDAIEVLPKLIWHYNEPFADSSAIPTYYVAKMTREYVTVALNGDGGDENFGGYERYVGMEITSIYDKLPRSIKAVWTNLIKTVRPVGSTKLNRFINGLILPPEKRYLRWMSVFDEERRMALYSPEFLSSLGPYEASAYLFSMLSRRDIENILDRVFSTDIMSYLPEDLLVKMDIATMANSLEARSPFLDHKLMEFAGRLPSRFKVRGFVTKYILKKALKKILPREILSRGKKGFGVPVGIWFKGELKGYLSNVLLDNRTLKRGYFKPDYVKQLVTEHTTGRLDHTHRLWALLNFELWHRMFIDNKI